MTKQEIRNFIAKRTAKFFNDGDVINLGIGMPTLCLEHLPEGVDIWIESENGVLGLAGAPENEADGDIDIVDASGAVSTMRPGGCCFSSFDSFGLIRGGHVAATVLGAYEVDQEGNLANWMVPGKTCAGMGGAMDLVSGAKKVLIMMEHTDKYGN
ncbi:MAG: succinyl-CoA--3-ketoacid-CoA transferase, partial [Clostridia bacterium]|nr:succinyl-CoA--3-ketoacid-CoA transferase [Clostridia bacterium]